MTRNAKAVPSTGGDSNMKAPELAPGAYPARVVGVVYLGVQEQRPFQGEAKKPIDEVRLTYELSDEFMQDEEGNDVEDKPRWFSEDIPFHSLNADRAKSTKRYKAIDPKDSCDGDFSKLLGMACQVVVVVNPGKGKHQGKTFFNIADVTPAPNLKGYVQADLKNPTVSFDPMDDNVSKEEFEALPEWIRTKILGAVDHDGSPLQAVLGGAPSAPSESSEEEEEMY
jgi:hypothetical protein